MKTIDIKKLKIEIEKELKSKKKQRKEELRENVMQHNFETAFHLGKQEGKKQALEEVEIIIDNFNDENGFCKNTFKWINLEELKSKIKKEMKE